MFSTLDAYLGQFSIAGSMNSCNFALGNADLEHTAFGDTIEGKYPGLLQPNVQLGGWYKAGVGQPDKIMCDAMLARSSMPLTLCPPYAPAAVPGVAGNLAYIVTGAEFGYEIGEAHGRLAPYKLTRKPRSGGSVVRGRVAIPGAVYADTVTGAAYSLGGVLAAGSKLVVVIHVFAVTGGGSWTLTVESDELVGFGSPTVRLTSAAVTAAGWQLLELAGPIATDAFWRAVFTKTGGTSIETAVAFGYSPPIVTS
jgi:hypothetical protein